MTSRLGTGKSIPFFTVWIPHRWLRISSYTCIFHKNKVQYRYIITCIMYPEAFPHIWFCFRPLLNMRKSPNFIIWPLFIFITYWTLVVERLLLADSRMRTKAIYFEHFPSHTLQWDNVGVKLTFYFFFKETVPQFISADIYFILVIEFYNIIQKKTRNSFLSVITVQYNHCGYKGP